MTDPLPPAGLNIAEDELYRLFMTNVEDYAIFCFGADGRIATWNAGAARILGYTEAEILGQSVGVLFTPEDRAAGVPEKELHAAREQGRVRDERWHVRKDGTYFRANGVVTTLRTESGILRGYTKIVRDVTTRFQQQEATAEQLAQQARLFDTVLSSIVDFAYIFDRAGRFTYVNQALLDLWQKPLEDALGKTFFELAYPAELAARLHQQIETVFRTGQPLRDETPYTGGAGTTGYYEYIFVPVFDKNGEVEVVAGSTRDITAMHQEKAEKASLYRTLQIERARLTTLFMQAPAFIAVLKGPTHIIEMANPLYLQLVGHREVVGKTVLEALPEVEAQGYIALLDEVYRSGKPFIGKEIRVLLSADSNGGLHERYIDFIYQPLIEADGSTSGIFVHGVDWTERKHAEQALEERAHEIDALNVRLRRAIQETHHRVKNNLQIISALAEVQTEAGDILVPASALNRIGQHTRSLASIHDLLTQEAKTSLETDSLSTSATLAKLLPLLRAAAGGRNIHYHTDDFRLSVQQTGSLCLLINELVSNALKHAQGDVHVSLTAYNGFAHLEVCDEGPGFPEGFDARKAANTGLDLIDSTGRYDLRGTITYENRAEGGGRARVTFPLPALSE